MAELAVTDVSSVAQTTDSDRDAFLERGLEDASQRTVAIVTQPGVDFSHSSVHPFEPAAASALSRAILEHPEFACEARSTDDQTRGALGDLVAGHYLFLKVGPELTFAFTSSPSEADERDALWTAMASRYRWIRLYFLRRPNLPDEADNHVVELAVAGGAEAIVTQNAFAERRTVLPGRVVPCESRSHIVPRSSPARHRVRSR